MAGENQICLKKPTQQKAPSRTENRLLNQPPRESQRSLRFPRACQHLKNQPRKKRLRKKQRQSPLMKSPCLRILSRRNAAKPEFPVTNTRTGSKLNVSSGLAARRRNRPQSRARPSLPDPPQSLDPAGLILQQIAHFFDEPLDAERLREQAAHARFAEKLLCLFVGRVTGHQDKRRQRTAMRRGDRVEL
ncbi:MAG: hypothetical protein QOD99_2281 [Chthoniobacter sp.]|nr:hypothetical protein [Chthoniobacter sp.]